MASEVQKLQRKLRASEDECAAKGEQVEMLVSRIRELEDELKQKEDDMMMSQAMKLGSPQGLSKRMPMGLSPTKGMSPEEVAAIESRLRGLGCLIEDEGGRVDFLASFLEACETIFKKKDAQIAQLTSMLKKTQGALQILSVKLGVEDEQ